MRKPAADKSQYRLVFFVNVAWFFVSHRLHLAEAAKRAGFDVHVIAGPEGDEAISRIAASGIAFHPLSIRRGERRLFADVKALFGLFRILFRLRPDIVHNVTIKPVLLGTLAARLLRVPCVVNAISGLGYLFADKARSRSLRSAFVLRCYGRLFRRKQVFVIVQNADDSKLFVEGRLALPEQVVKIRGSGVDLQLYKPAYPRNAVPRVVLAARMLWDKGVREFCEAAGALCEQGVSADFLLVGGIDYENPAAIPRAWLDDVAATGHVQWLGHRDDMATVLQSADIVCLPSYREGLPKVLLEAAACECAIVATDVPGCREVVAHEATGLLVPARDSVALADSIRRLLFDPVLRKSLGQNARRYVESELSATRVAEQTLTLYRRCIDSMHA